MLKIDNTLLQEIGLGTLPDPEKNSLLKHIYETLEMRVGMRLADQMTNEQLDEFEQYFEAKDDAGAFKWLESNFPNYKDIVQQEFDKLKSEVQQSAPQILMASQVTAQQAAAAPGQPPVAPAMAMPGQDPMASAQPMAPPAAPQPAQPYNPAPAPQAPTPPTPPTAPSPWPPQPPQPAQPQPPFPTQQPPAGPQQYPPQTPTT